MDGGSESPGAAPQVGHPPARAAPAGTGSGKHRRLSEEGGQGTAKESTRGDVPECSMSRATSNAS